MSYIEKYLTYIPSEIVKEKDSSGKSTTKPSNARLELNVREWDDFKSVVEQYRSELLGMQLKKKLSVEFDNTPRGCGNEADLEIEMNNCLFIPLQKLWNCLGRAGKFQSKPQELALDADFAWVTYKDNARDV